MLKDLMVEPQELRADVVLNQPPFASTGVMCLCWWESRENQKFFSCKLS